MCKHVYVYLQIPLYQKFTYKLPTVKKKKNLPTVYLVLCLILEMEKLSGFGSCTQIEDIIIKLPTYLVYLTHMPSISLANENANSFHKGASFVGHLSQVTQHSLVLNFQSAEFCNNSDSQFPGPALPNFTGRPQSVNTC